MNLIKNMVLNKLAGLQTNKEGIINAVTAAETEKTEQLIRLATVESQIKECEKYLEENPNE